MLPREILSWVTGSENLQSCPQLVWPQWAVLKEASVRLPQPSREHPHLLPQLPGKSQLPSPSLLLLFADESLPDP